MGPAALAHVLRPLQSIFPAGDYPDLLVGLELADDAAVYRLSDAQALIATTDFFTPIVDDPYAYGAIAAANSLSDIYAMGGQPICALNIAAFPEDLPSEIISEILRGGAEKVREAGAVVAGGHTITDKEPKFGLAALGLVHPQRIFSKGGGKAGDVLVLTKPLGTGILATAGKFSGTDSDRLPLQPEHLQAAIASMVRLNREAALAGQAAGVRGGTDVTGFGLLGCASEMAARGGAGIRIEASRVPLLPGTLDYATAGYWTGASLRNPAYFSNQVRCAPEMDRLLARICWEAETAGGLLLAIPEQTLDVFMAACDQYRQSAWQIGRLVSSPGVEMVL